MKSRVHEILGDRLSIISSKAGADIVLPEHRRIDRLIVLSRKGRTYCLAGEIELSERHCESNACKALLSNKCDAMLSVCPNTRVRDRVKAKIKKSKQIPDDMKSMIRVCCFGEINTEFISAWFDSVVNRDECLSPKEEETQKSEVCHE